MLHERVVSIYQLNLKDYSNLSKSVTLTIIWIPLSEKSITLEIEYKIVILKRCFNDFIFIELSYSSFCFLMMELILNISAITFVSDNLLRRRFN